MFLKSKLISPVIQDLDICSSLRYYTKHVFNITKIQKKIELHTLNHAQYSGTINHTLKMAFIP
jgi:hypothetical protein